MRTDGRQEQIRKVVATCKDHWRSRGIPEDQVRMMAEEAEEDLRDEFQDGKTAEEATGYDVEEFARHYAEDFALDSPKDRFLIGLVVVAIFLLFTVVLTVFLARVVEIVPFPETWLPWYSVVVLAAMVAAVWLFWPGRSR